MKTIALAIASLGSAGLVAACGSGHPASTAPSARSLAARMHCTTAGPGQHFDGADTRQDISLSGKAAGCEGGEVWTFPSAAAQRRWLSQIQNASTQTYGGYNWLVVGRLWAVYPGTLASSGAVARETGGRESSYL